LTDSDVKTFLKTLHREEMEFVIIGGVALGEEIERNGLGLSERIFSVKRCGKYLRLLGVEIIVAPNFP